MKSLIKMLLMSVVMIAGNCFAQFSQTQGNYSQSILNGYLVNETGLAYSKSYTVDVSSLEASRISAQTIVSSVTFAASSFYDGNASSGVITVVDYLQLSSAAATGTLTVATSSAADGMYVIVGGQKFTNGTNFIMRTSSMVSAYNLGVVIAAALPTWTVTYSSLTTSAIALTAPYGLNYNNYALILRLRIL